MFWRWSTVSSVFAQSSYSLFLHPPLPPPPSLISHLSSMDVKQHVYFLNSRRAQERFKKKEAELGFHSWMVCLVAEFFLNSCFPDIVFTTLFRTPVETAVSGVHKLLRTGGVPTPLTLAVADRLFGLYGSEHVHELFTSTRSPPFPVPNKPYGFCGR